LGAKSNYITAANQLTISHGSDIENVITGLGDDTVIATDLDNIIVTGSGSDTIFAGGGTDIITSGTGADRIDLSEYVQSRDTVTLSLASTNLGIDTIYGFEQGAFGDIFDVSAILSSGFELFPLVVLGSALTANFSGGILRLTGLGVSSATDLSIALEVGGVLETLSMDKGASAMIISADSQATGEEQCVFVANNSNGEISITQLTILQGNALDIDQWHVDNFSLIA
jgi:Ca2+-binding RTX toxin-like protein